MIPVEEILNKISHVKFVGDSKSLVDRPIPLDPSNKNPQALMWVSNQNSGKLEEIRTGTIICGTSFNGFKENCNYIVCENPRMAFQEVLNKFYVTNETPEISSTAVIDPTVKLGKDCRIGHQVVIEKNCVIGDNVSIDHNTVIKHDTEIHNYVKIGANCTIGGVGFGYEQNNEKKYVLIPHLGNVVIKNFAEVGNNTCIDRAVLGSTILEENVKIDNLVHIAHGVIVGKNSLVIANAMVAGSTVIGENVWVAPSASILNKKTIASNSFIGMGAVVLKDVAENQTVIGNPGKPLIKSEGKS
ncbi:MAG: hypothetical protein QM734_07660 [Cyclobacteriaceae bacterium]